MLTFLSALLKLFDLSNWIKQLFDKHEVKQEAKLELTESQESKEITNAIKAKDFEDKLRSDASVAERMRLIVNNDK